MLRQRPNQMSRVLDVVIWDCFELEITDKVCLKTA